ncbi:MAG: hypothetical protein LBI64_07840, partial [Coriobacteriales bacterium]|nr:hypothetical protein [Coriobacteriales bacterium]
MQKKKVTETRRFGSSGTKPGKRLLAMLLTLILACSMLPTAALAENAAAEPDGVSPAPADGETSGETLDVAHTASAAQPGEYLLGAELGAEPEPETPSTETPESEAETPSAGTVRETETPSAGTPGQEGDDLGSTEAPEALTPTNEGRGNTPSELAPMAAPSDIGTLAAGDYNAGDIAVINAIIDNNGLQWTKASPADGSFIPADWWPETSAGPGITWSEDATDKRIRILRIYSQNLTGTLNVSGLAELINLNCLNNQLTGVNVSGNTSLDYLNCSNNWLTALDVSNNTSLSYLTCTNNGLTALDVSHCRLYSLDLNENPLQSIKLSDRSEIRIATEPAGAGTVVVTDFKWDSIAQDFTLLAYDGDDNDDKGFRQWTYGFENLPTTTEFDNPATFRHYGSVIMIVTAHFGDLPIYDLGDIAVVNELIDNGVLPWERAPEDGSAIPDNWDGMSWSSSTYHKRLTGWTIYPELSGTVKLSGLTALRTLVCNNNEHTSLDVSGCVALTSLTCNNNLKLKSLDISGCTALQTVNFNNNSLVILRLTGGTVHIDVPEPLWGTVRTAGFSASEKKLSLTATAQSGYTFTGWTGIDADTMTANPVAFVVSGTMNVTANFAPVLYHPDDVAVINTLIAHNNLGWTPVSANGTTHPIDWTGVTWSDDARYKRIRALDLSDCSLEGAADISGLAALTSLDCSRNELASLDVSGCAVLETLDLNGNPLRHLKLQDGNELQIGIVSQDDASQDDATVRVTAFTLSDRSITLKAEGGEAGLQNWRGLDSTAGSKDNPVTFTIVGVMSVTAYFVSYSAFDIAVINRVIENNGLEWTKASPADGSYVPNDWGGVSWSGDTLDKQITSLSINTNNSAQKDLTGALDLSGLVALTYLNCDANQLVSLDVSGCVALTELRCSSNQLASLDIVGCTALDGLYCFDNQLESLDVSGLKALRYLYGYNNQLTSLKVSGCTALVRLYCYNNRLVDLDVSGLDALFDFRCYDNQLESLDVSGLDALDDLECYDNQLTSLDVSGLKALTQIVCDNNKLTSLDVSDCAVLRYLKCENNQLATLDLSGLAALRSLYCVGNPVQNLILPAGHELLTAVDPEGSGTVYVAQIDASLLYPAVPVNNAWVTLTATPESGYAFKEWTWTGVENASVTGNSVRFQIPSQNMTVTAHFRGLPYHPDDVALINGIILNNGLDWTLASPADGTAVPSDWTGVQWSSDARFKQITSLDISGCDLKGALDVSGLVELKALDCDGNRLTGLDVSGCAALEALSLSGNPLQTLKLQDGDELQIEVLPSGGGTVMTGAFNLSTKGLTLTAIAEGGGSFTGWTGAAVSTTNPVSFNISGNMTVTAGFESSLYHVGDIAVINAIIEDNGLNWTKADPADGSSIPSDWVSGLSRVVWSTDTLNKRIMSLDISGRTLTGALDVSGLTALTALYCSNNQFTSLDVSGCRALSYLSCAGNQLVSLDVSGCDALSTLSCGSNLLTSLDVSDCRTLNILECQNNQLTSLKLSINLALRQLLCQDNQLTSLDVSKNSALRYLYCQNNQLTSLDVSMLPVWSGSASTYGLSCAGNPLQSLKLQAGNELYLPVSPSGTGAVHVSTFNYGANANSIVYLTATAESGCNFTGWTGAVSGTDNPIRLTLSGSMTVTANFEGTPTPVLYTLTVTGGTGSGSYEAGTVVPVSAGTPPSGKVFD